MKQIYAPLLAHYKTDSLTIAQCFKLSLRDGSILGFTSFDRDIRLQNEPLVVYKAFGGMTPSAIDSSSAFNVDNLDVDGYIEDGRITESDIKNGKYDYADVEIFEINWADLPYDISKVNNKRSGKLGEITVEKSKFVAEIRGLMQNLQSVQGILYQATCRANLGDVKCGVNIIPFTFTGAISSVSFNRVLTIPILTQTDGYFNNGKLVFTNGLNINTVAEVKSWTLATKEMQIQLPANYLINTGDTVSVTRGCNKLIKTCDQSFSNAVNFRGEPYIPQIETLINKG